MTENKKHSPTPWKLTKEREAGRFLITDSTNEVDTALVTLRTDAVHVVKCVNAHDALRSSLGEMHDTMLLLHINGGCPTCDREGARCPLIQRSSAALKKAGAL
jgi:hypothetical protein